MSPIKVGRHGLLNTMSTAAVVLLGFLFASLETVEADSLQLNSTCTPCSESDCSDPSNQSNCWQHCIYACEQDFYPITRNSSFVCNPTPTTATTTVVTTAATFTTAAITTTTITTTTTTTTPTTATDNAHTTQTNHSTQTLVTGAKRRRREVTAEDHTDTQTEARITTTMPTTTVPTTTVPTIPAPTTTVTTITVPTTIVTTTIQTTTEIPNLICRKCSINYCSNCTDDAQYKTICARCKDGYHLSSDFKSCIKEDDKFPVGAIVGIVVGGTGFIIILVVFIVCVTRRCCHSPKNHDINMEEESELNRLGYAPPPPGDDPSKRYDSLQACDQEESPSYSSPVENSNDSTYANLNGRETQQNQNPYANTPHASSSFAASPSNVQQDLDSSFESTPSESTPSESTPPESSELYEYVAEKKPVPEDTQEIYSNNESILAAQHSNQSPDDDQEIYVNDNLVDTEEVYMNA